MKIEEKKKWIKIIEKDDLEVKRIKKAYREKDKIFFDNWFKDYLGKEKRKEERDNWL